LPSASEERYIAFGFNWILDSKWSSCQALKTALNAIARDENKGQTVVFRKRRSLWRSVFRINIEHEDGLQRLYVKKYTRSRFRFKKSVLRPYREYRNIQIARNAGFIVPEPVAYGEKLAFNRKVRAAVVVTADLKFPTLEQYLANKPKPLCGEWLRALASFVASIHEKGFLHGDLAIINMVISPGQPPVFGLLDMDRFQKTDKNPKARIKDLAHFVHSLRWVINAKEQVEFLHTYLAESSSLNLPFDEFHGLLQHYLRLRARTTALHEFGHCIEKRKHLNAIPGGLLKKQVYGHLIADLADDPPNSPEAWVALLSHRLDPFGGELIVRTGRPRTSRLLLRESILLKSWRVANFLYMLGLPAPEPVCYLGSRHFGSETVVFYLPKDTVPLIESLTNIETAEVVVTKLGEFLAVLHDGSMLHNRLDTDAFLVTQTSEGPQVFSNGLDQLSIVKQVTEKIILTDITKLSHKIETHSGFGLSDRFIKAYRDTRYNLPKVRLPNCRPSLL
jgi:tRNA A-37 threonylcarbamoyl transferase component Bud32